jgi:hypothetical protein
MKEIYRSNHPIKLSYVESQLLEAGITPHRLDQHTSMVEGSIGAIQCRIMVAEEDSIRAERVLQDLELDI